MHQGSCNSRGCAISHTFTIPGWSSGKTALLTITQTGDLGSSDEYTTLYAGGNRLTDCKSGTASWKTPSQCSGVDVTRYVSSSGTLALKLDATADVNADDDDQTGPLSSMLTAKFSLSITGSVAIATTTTTTDTATTTTAPTTAAAPSYLGEFGIGSLMKCPTGTFTVDTEAGCKIAAIYLGKQYVGHQHTKNAHGLQEGK